MLPLLWWIKIFICAKLLVLCRCEWGWKPSVLLSVATVLFRWLEHVRCSVGASFADPLGVSGWLPRPRPVQGNEGGGGQYLHGTVTTTLIAHMYREWAKQDRDQDRLLESVRVKAGAAALDEAGPCQCRRPTVVRRIRKDDDERTNGRPSCRRSELANHVTAMVRRPSDTHSFDRGTRRVQPPSSDLQSLRCSSSTSPRTKRGRVLDAAQPSHLSTSLLISAPNNVFQNDKLCSPWKVEKNIQHTHTHT